MKIKYLFKKIKNMRFKEYVNHAKEIGKKIDKSTFYVLFDMAICAFLYGSGYMDYFEFEFYLLTKEERKTYLTSSINNQIIAKYNNEIIKATNIYTKYPDSALIGAILIIKNNREIYFMDEVYNEELKNFYSSHLIKWEIIKKYLTLGYKIFNFGSISNRDKKNGNYLFKMGFGGKVYECIGRYDLVINKWLYHFIKFIYNIKK